MNKKILISFFFLLILFSGCKTIPQPENIPQSLDYTKEDVVNNERKNIKTMMEQDSVQALLRSYYLQDEKLIEECAKLICTQIENAIKDKDYVEVIRYVKSLEAVEYKKIPAVSKDIQSKLKDDLPGTQIPSSKMPKTIQDCINATVTIWVDKGIKVSNGAGYQDIVIGSGFFIDKRGYLVTNYHVIQDLVDSTYEGYSRLYIKLHTDTETKIPAKVTGYDSTIDLALLKTEIEPEFILSLGSSADLSVGDKISAIGSPIGLEGTLTSGIISSTERKLNTMGTVFQLDAAINSGNSGGPLIDQSKKVQAVVFAGMLQFQGLNFAIPVEYLKQELPVLYNGGQVFHVWIGAYGHTKRNKNVKEGVEIQYVMPGSSSHFSKLKEGDVITKLDDQKITSLEDFQFALLKYVPGTLVKCSYIEGVSEKEKNCVILLEKRPENPGVKFFQSDLITDSFIPLFGMKLTPSSTTNKKSYTITKVINGSTADEMSFSVDDPVTVQNVDVDFKNKRIIAQLYVQRRSKGFLDITMMIGSAFDSPYYF